MKNSSWKKLISLATCSILLLGILAGCGGNPQQPAGGSTSGGGTTANEPAPGSFPRNETLYYGGMQWGTIASFNPFHPSPSNWTYTNGRGLLRMLVYEGLFAYNPLDGSLNGILGKEYSWNEKELTVKMNPDAKWSDGEALTAHDVAYTFELAKKYTTVVSTSWEYLESVTAVDDETVVFKGKEDNFSPKFMEVFISGVYIVPKHTWEKVDAECAGDNGKFIEYASEDLTLVSSGPYRFQLSDDTKTALVRDDNYWGQAESMFGKLASPKYLVHNIFKDNDASMAAFKEGQIDVNQQFMPQIWKLWEENKLPISTYIPEPPYYIPGSIPSIWFNLSKPGLDDPAVRRALAMAIDYNMIGQNAMSGYTAPMQPSLLLPTPAMQALIDTDKLKEYQWTGNQVEEANKLLDEAGWVKGADGIREKDGVKLSFKVECPTGWTDWNASLEIVAQSGRNIGMDLVTNFREFAVYFNDFQAGKVDIGMWAIEANNVAAPWSSARMAMSSIGVPAIGSAATSNYGRYKNPKADELIANLAVETDPVKVKEMWTELNIIYLTDVPSVGLMYRPGLFHEVNESVWTGYPQQGDNSNIPPTVLSDGWGIKGIYNIEAK